MTCRHHLTEDGRRIVITLQVHLDTPPEQHLAGCKGCWECDMRHCSVCASHLRLDEIGSCVECIGRVRRDLANILDLVALLPDQSISAARLGHLVASDPIPGGDAIVMLANGSEGLSDDGHTNTGDPMPPSYLLNWWEEVWRNALDNPYPRHRAHQHAHHTLMDAYHYLDRNLGWAAGHHAGFRVFARDVGGLRRRLEELLFAGNYPAEGVACFKCGCTLVRDFRDPSVCRHTDEAWLAEIPPHQWIHTLASYPELGAEHAACDQGGLLDPDHATGWHCPRCKRVYSPGEYGLAVKAMSTEYAEVLPATELGQRLGVQPATIWQWAQRGHIRRRGRGADRRTLYDVADALRHAQNQAEAS